MSSMSDSRVADSGDSGTLPHALTKRFATFIAVLFRMAGAPTRTT